MSEPDTIPSATVVREEPNPDSQDHVLVWIICPLCGEEHMHGMGLKETRTHRNSHCLEQKAHDMGYYLERQIPMR